MAFSLALWDRCRRGKMCPSLHIALGMLLLRSAFSCESWEYSIRGECCPKCAAGLRVLKHCTSATSTACVSCNPGWYTEHPNGLSMCLKCRVCAPGNHMQVKEPCHYTRNAKCTCQPGFFCFHQLEVDSCDVCIRHTTVPRGFMVTRAGTETHDVSFEPCPPGTFSSKEMSFSCIKWTNCSEKGWVQKHEGNTTSDAVCEPPPETNLASILIPVFVVLLVLALLLLATFLIWKKRKCPVKAFGHKKAKEAYSTPPENECMVTPIQETAPNLGQPSYGKC